MGRIGAFKLMFCLYGGLGLLAAVIYRRLPHSLPEEHHASTPLGPSRSMVYRLAALFSLDAFAGGFVVQSLLALWLFERFGLSLAAASVFFFWTSVLSALSFPARRLACPARRARQHHGLHPYPLERVSHRGGVHAESHRRSWALAGAGGARANGRADAHLLRHGRGDARRGRASAASVTADAAQSRPPPSARPSPASRSARRSGLPLVLCGGLKIVYDLLLLYSCRHVRPPEESRRDRV